MTKFIIVPETIEVDGKTLHRIVAAPNNPANLPAGTVGGWVESERNLAQEGPCWIYNNAMSMGGSRITGQAKLADQAKVVNSTVRDLAIICGDAVVEDSLIGGTVMINQEAHLTGVTQFGSAIINRRLTRTAVFIDGLPRRLTIMDHHLRVGGDDCDWTPTHEEFADVTEEGLLKVWGREGIRFYKEWAPATLHAIQTFRPDFKYDRTSLNSGKALT